MSSYHEGCQLTIDEIAAVMSLAGKRTLVGFQTEEVEDLTTERAWSACAGLMRDAMMTQIDGKFRLCRVLAEVMRPMCQAKAVLALTPGSDLYAQQIYYAADTVTCMERSPFGRYILSAMEFSELAEAIADHLELTYPVESPDGENAPGAGVEANAPREVLQPGSRFLAECLDPDTGGRTGWLRVIEQGLFSWVQWTANGAVCCEPLTKETLEGLLPLLMRGEDQV